MIETFELTEAQLDRAQDFLQSRVNCHIIHLLYDDLVDRYVLLADCDPPTATWIRLC